MNNKLLAYLGLFISSLMLSACGGGGGSESTSSNAAQTESPTIYTGRFIDSAVIGLSYQTATQQGQTNADGEFSYQLNETVTFSIGSITLPEVTATNLITPLDIFSTEDIYDDQVINLIRLLQSLDNDQDPTNGIVLTEAVHTMATGLDSDFSNESYEQLLMDLSLDANNMVTTQDAAFHFQQSLDELNINFVSNCGNGHAKVGQSGHFQTYSHNVAGTATFIDNCTIEITNFDYDGEGPEVYFYAALNSQFDSPDAFIIGERLTGTVFSNDTLQVSLPQGKSLDDLDSLSVWCVDFSVDFGSLTFD
ncbi:DM13 domain-containing protein [Neiella marina]|uniref:DM13 domain-containing protein n=1 Tax=Neiella holothuriorum TaxID=2870530 RepID=A0ABS7EHC9_9GAMM|nr:DM13 domain-containing protein [Neiella holothuriorum]MBW8191754.1 DM13 domain-containing protein [Neiella holothuriorum]